MLTIVLKDWTGLETSTTNIEEAELGFDGNLEKLQKFAQRVADNRNCSVTVYQDDNKLVTASYLNSLI